MTTVVEQTKGHGDSEQARKSRPILMQQIEQGTLLLHAAKCWETKVIDVTRLRGISENRPGFA